MTNDPPDKFHKTNLRIVRSKKEYLIDEYYYPYECYTEDFDIEAIETMSILKEFRPKNIDN